MQPRKIIWQRKIFEWGLKANTWETYFFEKEIFVLEFYRKRACNLTRKVVLTIRSKQLQKSNTQWRGQKIKKWVKKRHIISHHCLCLENLQRTSTIINWKPIFELKWHIKAHKISVCVREKKSSKISHHWKMARSEAIRL